MVSLPEELEARETAARCRVEELQAEAAGLDLRLERAREDLSRLEITRETVVLVLAELSAAETGEGDPVGETPESEEASVPPGIGVMMVPPWREGLIVAVLPDVYRDIVEVIADAPGPLQAKADRAADRSADDDREDRGDQGETQAAGGRGWLDEDTPGRFALARQGPGRDRDNSQ